MFWHGLCILLTLMFSNVQITLEIINEEIPILESSNVSTGSATLESFNEKPPTLEFSNELILMNESQLTYSNE